MVVVANDGDGTDEFRLLDAFTIFWRDKWVFGLSLFLSMVLAAVYALSATEWYRADVLLTPAEESSTTNIGGQLGGLAGLAGLAGISVGGGGSAEPLAILRSREFLGEFVNDYELLPVLLSEDWDDVAQKWKANDPEDWPDIRDAVEILNEDILGVSESLETGLVSVSVTWTDGEVAADWANILIDRLNNFTRQRALVTAQTNVDYLEQQMGETTIASLQQAIGSLLESELQKLMLARGNEEFSFRVIDKAEAPKRRERPRRILIVAVAGILGGLAAFVFLCIRHAVVGVKDNEDA